MAGVRDGLSPFPEQGAPSLSDSLGGPDFTALPLGRVHHTNPPPGTLPQTAASCGGLESPGEAGTGISGRVPRVLVQDYSHHNHGPTSNTTNTHYAPVVNFHEVGTVNLRANDDLDLLDRLPTHPDISSQWNNYVEGSRDGDMTEVQGWADDLRIKVLMFWIHGPAGTGKSTLARQLKYDLQSRGRLGASVFLSQLPTDTWGPETIIRLIGGEIGRNHPKAIPTIAEAVRQCHSASLEVLVEMFIHNPLQALQLPYPVTVLIDAMDEWRSHYHFLRALKPLSSLSSLVRFVVLSRLGPRAQHFKELSVQPHQLRPISVEVMQRYIDGRFNRIEWPTGRKPQERETMNLANMANGLFIWIATACSLLERRGSNPHDTLTSILHRRQNVGESHVLAKLYYDAIGLVFPGPEAKNAVRELLGFLLVLQEPLPLDAFCSLSGVNTHAFAGIMSNLKVLQIRHPVDSRTTVYPANMLFHASFTEYLTSTSTPLDIAFPISLLSFHLRLGKACLGAVAQITASAADLHKLYLSPKSVYGVGLWPFHVVAGSLPVEPDLSQVGKKVQRRPFLRRLANQTKALVLKQTAGDLHKPVICTSMMGLLEGVVTFGQLCRWVPLFLKVLRPGQTSSPPLVDGVPSLMCAVAGLLDDTSTSAMVFRVPCLEVAVHFSPLDAENWRKLGDAYSSLAKTTDSPELIHQCVSAHQHALDVAQAALANNCPLYMHVLAQSLWGRAVRTGGAKDIESAIELEREVLRSKRYPPPLDRAQPLHRLAACLESRFGRLGSIRDLQEAILLYREALVLRPSGHPDRSMSLNNLANALQSCFEQLGSAGDLQEAVVLHREALELRPSGHPGRSVSLNNLAGTLQSCFKQSRSAGELQEAVVLHREALELHPPGHPDRFVSLNNLAGTLRSLFQTSGLASDLEEAIIFGQEALLLCPRGHPKRADTLWNMQLCLHKRFKLKGTVEDLREAIALSEEALVLYRPGSSDHEALRHTIIPRYIRELADATSSLASDKQP